jgi:hypothetical protein
MLMIVNEPMKIVPKLICNIVFFAKANWILLVYANAFYFILFFSIFTVRDLIFSDIRYFISLKLTSILC